jgi:hypothetical protein
MTSYCIPSSLKLVSSMIIWKTLGKYIMKFPHSVTWCITVWHDLPAVVKGCLVIVRDGRAGYWYRVWLANVPYKMDVQISTSKSKTWHKDFRQVCLSCKVLLGSLTYFNFNYSTFLMTVGLTILSRHYNYNIVQLYTTSCKNKYEIMC